MSYREIKKEEIQKKRRFEREKREERKREEEKPLFQEAVDSFDPKNWNKLTWILVFLLIFLIILSEL
tara:strand:- start:677 stop:877 length:201 start_codon:yes stop_codon:yes gene_type:complete